MALQCMLFVNVCKKYIYTKNPPDWGIFYFYILYIYIFSQMNYNLLESSGNWIRGCHKPAIVGAKYLMASLSDVIPVVLCRYLSLTLISRGAVCYITGETRKQQNQYYSDL